MMGIIHDPDLQHYLQSSLQMKQQRIQKLGTLMEKAKNINF